MSSLKAKEYQRFEQIKHIDETGSEYWFAHELASALEYTKWRNFSKVIDRAMLACRNSGFNIEDRFPDVRKTVEMPPEPRMVGFAEVSKTKKLAPVLEYTEWRNFSKVIDRTMLACQNGGFNVADHFPELRKMVKMPPEPRLVGFPDVRKTKNSAPVLEYTKWRNFSKVIDRAMLACRNSGFDIFYQFPDVRKLIKMPSEPRLVGFVDLNKTKNIAIGFPDIRKTKMKNLKKTATKMEKIL